MICSRRLLYVRKRLIITKWRFCTKHDTEESLGKGYELMLS